MAEPIPTVPAVPFIIGGIVIFGLVSGPVLNALQKAEEASKYQLIDHVSETSDVPKGTMRIICVNQKKSWEKIVRVSRKVNGNWVTLKEVKCGDISGKTAKSSSEIKYDDYSVPLDFHNDLMFEYRKPSFAGIWVTVATVNCSVAQQKSQDGKTLYVYWDNDADGYFTKHPGNRLTASQLF